MRLQSNLDEKVARDQRRSKKVNFWRVEGSRLNHLVSPDNSEAGGGAASLNPPSVLSSRGS